MNCKFLFFVFSLFFVLFFSLSVFSIECGSSCNSFTTSPPGSDPNIVKQDGSACVGGRTGSFWYYYSDFASYSAVTSSRCCIWACKPGYESAGGCPATCKVKAGCQTQTQVCNNRNGWLTSNCGAQYYCTCNPGYTGVGSNCLICQTKEELCIHNKPETITNNCGQTIQCGCNDGYIPQGSDCVKGEMCLGKMPVGPGVVKSPSVYLLSTSEGHDTWGYSPSTPFKYPCQWSCTSPYLALYYNGKASGGCCDSTKLNYGLPGSPYDKIDWSKQSADYTSAVNLTPSSVCCPNSTDKVTYNYLGAPGECCNTQDGLSFIILARDKKSTECCSTGEEITYGADGHAGPCCNTNKIINGKPNTVFDKGGVKEIKSCCFGNVNVKVYDEYGNPDCCSENQTKFFGRGAFAEKGTREISICCDLSNYGLIYGGVGRPECVPTKSCSATTPCTSVCKTSTGDFTTYKCESGKCVFDSVYRLKQYMGETCSKDNTKLECNGSGSKCISATQYQAYSCGVDGKMVFGAITTCPDASKICIEHKGLYVIGQPRNQIPPVTAVCTSPQDITSLYFTTGDNLFDSVLGDNQKVGFGEFGAGKVEFSTQNTFVGLTTPDEVFSRARDIIALLPPDKKIDLIMTNHGHSGEVNFGDGEIVFDLDYFNKFNWNPYNSLKGRINNLYFVSCLVGSDDPITGKSIGKTFATAWAKQFNTNVYASIPTMNLLGYRLSFPDKSEVSKSSPISIVVGPNGNIQYLHTTFYLADSKSYFSGATSTAYQTTVLSGDLNKVTVYIDDNSNRKLLVDMNDELQLCPSSVVNDVNVVLDSSNLAVNVNGFHIIVDTNSLISSSVTVNVKVLSVDCSSVYSSSLYQPAIVDSNILAAANSLMEKGLVNSLDYFKLKELNSKGAECLVDSDCASAACPLGILDCYNACVSGLCVPKASETLCDGLDSDGDGVVDNGCDKDGDQYVDVNKTCTGSFYSPKTKFIVDSNIVSTVLSLKGGWNLFSIPAYNVHSQDLANDCNAFIWKYNPNIYVSQGGYYSTVNGFLSPGEGYWIYSPNNCNFDFNRAPYVITNKIELNLLTTGWTITSGFKGDIKTQLGLSQPVWIWDLSTERPVYRMVNTASSTQGIWVRRNENGLVSCNQKDFDDTNPSVQ